MKNTLAIKFICIGLLSSSFVFAQNDKAVTAFKKSIELEKKQDYAGAIDAIQAIGDSSSYEYAIRLGWLNYKAGHKRNSLHYYQKAINLAPNAIEPRYGYGFPAYQLEDFSSIIAQDKKILEIDPNNKTINSNLGYIYYYEKDYKTAAVYFEKVVNLYPFDYDANLMSGWANLKAGKNQEAESFFNTVLFYSPKDASANDGLTNLKRTAPNDEKLMNAFLKSYELSEKSDFKGAIAILKETYDKSSYASNLRLGWLNYLAGLQTEAVGYYKIACELKPNAVEPKLGSAIPAEVMGNKNDMRVNYESVASIDPQNTTAHYKLGVLDYGKKDYVSAVSHFEKIVLLYPCDADGLLMLGWSNQMLGKSTEAKILFNKVLCLSPDNASAIQGLNYKPAEPEKPQDPKHRKF